MKKLLLVLTFFSVICFGAEWDYTGTSYYIGDQDGGPIEIYKYGDYWYMLGNDNDSVYQYNNTWSYTGTAYYIGAQDTFPASIYRYGDSCYLLGNDHDSVYLYDTLWSYTGTSYYVGDQDGFPIGMFRDDSYWYVLGNDYDSIYQYDNNWSYTGSAFYVGGSEALPAGISIYDNYFYVVGLITDSVYQYDSTGSYTGTSHYLGNEDGWPTGVYRYGNYWYMLGSDNDRFYKYEGTSIGPNAPTPIRIFDNAIFNAVSSPYVCTLSVVATDPQSDDIQYEILWDTDYGFSSASSLITGTYTSGDTAIEAILLGTTPAEAETLFYWKARAKDPDGSNAWSDWSAIRSFTMDLDLISDPPYWYQVAGDQFEQGTMDSVTVQGDSVVLLLTAGTLTSNPVAYADLIAEGSTRSNWDGAQWMKSSADDSIGLQIEYLSGGSWSPVPDGDLPGNSNYFFNMSDSFCNVDLSALVTTTYDTLRLIAKFIAYAGSPNPSLVMWALGEINIVSSVPLSDNRLEFALYLPNPNVLIRGTNTEIKYQLPRDEKVRLGVFDLLGREVTTLVDAKKARGIHSVSWRGMNDRNKPLACGIYFLGMEAGEFRDIKKLILLR